MGTFSEATRTITFRNFNHVCHEYFKNGAVSVTYVKQYINELRDEMLI